MGGESSAFCSRASSCFNDRAFAHPRRFGFHGFLNRFSRFSHRILTLTITPLCSLEASPGGTGGGVEASSIAILSVMTWSSIRLRKWVVLFDAQFHREYFKGSSPHFVGGQYHWSCGFTFVCAIGKNLLGKGLPHGPISLFFEAVSAFGTVGLSTGVTLLLSAGSKSGFGGYNVCWKELI